MKHFTSIMIFISAASLIIFIALITALLQRDKIEFTTGDELEIPIIYPKDEMKGSTNPSVVIVHFADFTSEYSADIYEHLNTLLEKYPEEIMVVWKDFPNSSLRPQAYSSAIAAHCAGNQNNFFTYGDYLIEHQFEINDDLYTAIAQEIGLRKNTFERCIKNKKTADLVESGINQANALGLTAAPTLYINDVKYTGS
ncbi:DsbA family protein, partial [Patescibacteria group bacterium]|nr:DsbA family protein [Patescibacteria group bacterium]